MQCLDGLFVLVCGQIVEDDDGSLSETASVELPAALRSASAAKAGLLKRHTQTTIALAQEVRPRRLKIVELFLQLGNCKRTLHVVRHEFTLLLRQWESASDEAHFIIWSALCERGLASFSKPSPLWTIYALHSRKAPAET